MSTFERFLHALLFEIGAIFSTILLMKSITDHHTAVLTSTIVLISLIAMGWNMIFNFFFDKWFAGERLARGLGIRLLHTVGFEVGLLFFTLPLVAFMLEISWWEAMVMDIGMTLFVMLYALGFNWIYDYIRHWWIHKFKSW